MADEQIKPVTMPQSIEKSAVNDVKAETAKVETSALDLKDHISHSIAVAALSAGQAVRDEERRLKLLSVKVVGPFGRFWRACKAAGVAFLMTLHAQS